MPALRKSVKNQSAVVLPLLNIDQERHRIANDLHDSIGSMLSTALLLFDTIEASNVARMEAVRKLLQDTQREVRRIAHDMMPGTLSKLGLTEGIHQILEDIQCSIDVEAYIENIEHVLPTEQHIHLYRLVQELLCNVVRHAKATALSLKIIVQPTHIYIGVKDNGIGTDLVPLDSAFQTIKMRLAALQGKMLMQSELGDGLLVEINIPIGGY
jgi:two-component system, NarL family, sensor kinase